MAPPISTRTTKKKSSVCRAQSRDAALVVNLKASDSLVELGLLGMAMLQWILEDWAGMVLRM
jgi:hypothetical protein